MAWRFTGVDPNYRAAMGAWSGYAMHNHPQSWAALVKRRSTGAWHSIHNIDKGNTSNENFTMEFKNTNTLISETTAGNFPETTATFTNIVDWGIYGYTWDGTATANKFVFRTRVGSGAWVAELKTGATDTPSLGAGYRHLIGIEAGGSDDADYDMCCIGGIKAELTQADFESLDMLSFLTWENIFKNANSWLTGFQDIGTQVDRAGNGGDELTRNGVTLVADPPGWLWSAPGVQTDIETYKHFPKPKLAAPAGAGILIP